MFGGYIYPISFLLPLARMKCVADLSIASPFLFMPLLRPLHFKVEKDCLAVGEQNFNPYLKETSPLAINIEQATILLSCRLVQRQPAEM